MRDYFFCVLIASVLSAVCAALAAGGALEKHVKYVCSLICAAAVFLPLTKALKSGINIEKQNLISEKSVSLERYAFREAEEESKAYIKNIVNEKFGITLSGVSIEIYSEENAAVVGEIRVTLSPGDKMLREDVAGFLLTALGGSVKVVISTE